MASIENNTVDSGDSTVSVDEEIWRQVNESQLDGTQDAYISMIKGLRNRYMESIPPLQPVGEEKVLTDEEKRELQKVQNLQLLMHRTLKLHQTTLVANADPNLQAFSTVCQMTLMCCSVIVDKLYVILHICVFYVYVCIFYIYIYI